VRLRFRKSIKVAPGVRVNLSKSGVGMSVGTKGVRVGVGPRGRYTSVSIPGTGIYGIEYHGKGRGNARKSGAAQNAQHYAYGEGASRQEAFPVPQELNQGTSSLGCLGMAAGVVLIFIQPLLGLAVLLGSVVIYSRSKNVKAHGLYRKANKSAKKGDYEQAAAALEEVLELKPEVALVRLHLGMLHFSREDYAQAIRYLEEYLRLEANETVKFALAQAYRQRGDLDQAVSVLQSLPQEAKQELDYIITLGSLFLDMDKPDLALEVLLTGPTRKRSMDQQIALFRYLLGLSYYRLDDRKRALAEFKKVYVYDKDFQDTASLLAELEGQ
jgi:tetratricopeptide (TPR) repeat protein